MRATELGAPLKVVYGYVDYRAAENLKRQGIGHISKYGGGDFILSKKDGCPSTKLALVVAGDEAPAGSTVYVCGDKRCKLNRPGHQEDPRTRANRLAEEAKARHEMNKCRAIYNALVKAGKKGPRLSTADYRLICLKSFERMYYEDSWQFVRVLGFIGPSEAKKLKVKPTDERDDGSAQSKFFGTYFEKAEPRELHSLLLQMALLLNRDRAPNSFDGDKHDPLLDAAKRWDIDVKGITSQTDKEFAPAQLEKAGAEKRRREKEKAEAKKPPGTGEAEAHKVPSAKSKGAKGAKAKGRYHTNPPAGGFIECEREKVLRPHTSLGVFHLSSSAGWRHLYRWDSCLPGRAWGATKGRPEGLVLLNPRALPPSCLEIPVPDY